MHSPRQSQTSIDRRNVLKGAAAAGLAFGFPLLGACAEPPSRASDGKKGLTHVKLTQAVNSLAYAQNYIAKAKGFYEQEGLAVETIVTDGGGPDVQAVLAGSAEFTINDGAQVLTAQKQGRRLVAVAATFGRCLVNATISKKAAERLNITSTTSHEQRLAALKGARIGVTAPGALTWQVARYDLTKAGLDPDKDARIVALGGGPSVLAALEKDQVDIIYISLPFGEAAVARGSGITLIDNSAGQNPALPSFMMEGLWVTPQTLERDGDTVEAMVKALMRASELLASSTPQAIADVLKPDFASFPPEVLTTAAGQLKSAVASDGRWDQQAMSITLDVLAKNKLLRQEGPVESVFDDRYL